MAKKKLTAKQEKFVQEYLLDLNATQAAIRAGYSEKTAGSIGKENLQKPQIAEAIQKRRGKLAEKTEVTQERIVAELAKIGFSNLEDYLDVGENGLAQVNLKNVTRDQFAALSEVNVESTKVGDSPVTVTKTKIKLSDKRNALVDLGKHLGMFKEHKDDTPQLNVSMTLDQLKKLTKKERDQLRELLSARAAEPAAGA